MPTLDRIDTLTAEGKERALDLLTRQLDDKRAGRYAWLSCQLECDGKPHAGIAHKHARPKQRPPEGDWLTWLLLAGRGFGKTRTGAEWSWRKARHEPRGCLVGATAGDARDVMIEGESGILAVTPAAFRPLYEPSKRRLTYPNGALQTVFSADEPDRLRGPQHYYAWADELAAWKHLEDAWTQLQLGLRLGVHPQAVVSTTPRPLRVVRELVEHEGTHLTRGSTYENVHNLAAAWRERVISKYEGTRLGRQELYAELLGDVEGALWTLAQIDALRTLQLSAVELAPQLQRIVVAVDPAATATEQSDETGIVVAGTAEKHHCPVCGPTVDAHAFVLADLSGRYSPDTWASRAVTAYETYQADAIVAEVNNGGDMVGAVLRTVSARARYRKVTATRGKRVRAEPVAALYEQSRVHHVGALPTLEDQLVTWTPESSDVHDDRLDAAVWALTDLMLTRRSGVAMIA